MGNPHCVTFVEKASDEMVMGLGPLVEQDSHFPNRVNVEFVEVLSKSKLFLLCPRCPSTYKHTI